MPIDHLGEFFIRCEPLPLQARAPVLEEAPRPALALVVPELAEGFFQNVGRVQPAPPKWIGNIVQDDACRPKGPNSLKRYGKIILHTFDACPKRPDRISERSPRGGLSVLLRR